MRIALIGPTHPYKGGIAQHTTQLAHALKRSGHDVVLEGWDRQYPAALYRGTLTVPGEDPEVPEFENCRRELSWNRPGSWLRVARRLRRADVAVLVVGNPVQIVPFLSMIPAWRSSGVRTIALVHNVSPHEGHFWDGPLMRRLIDSVDAVMVHSADQESAARAIGGQDVRVHELPPNLPVKVEIPRIRRRSRTDPLNVLFFGLVRPYKGLDVLLEAMPRVSNVRLTIAGEFWSPREETQSAIARLGIADRVRIDDGYVPAELLPELFAAHDLVALPYKTVTGSGIIKVAFGYNRPIIVSDIGTLAEEIRGGLGLSFVAGSPESLADALLKASEPDVYNAMASAVDALPDSFEEEWSDYVHILLGLDR